jgi:tetratricopeptide (TPR) repeat protein
MGRAFLSGVALCLIAGPAGAQPDSRTVVGVGNELLSAGADAIRAGRYDEGIHLTELGLERPGNLQRDRAAALSNLCAAYAASARPDFAITHCSASLAISSSNWRAFSNRAYAYLLKGMYAEATFDVDAAAVLNPNAREVATIRGLINEASLQPRVIMEEHQ